MTWHPGVLAGSSGQSSSRRAADWDHCWVARFRRARWLWCRSSKHQLEMHWSFNIQRELKKNFQASDIISPIYQLTYHPMTVYIDKNTSSKNILFGNEKQNLFIHPQINMYLQEYSIKIHLNKCKDLYSSFHTWLLLEPSNMECRWRFPAFARHYRSTPKRRNPSA